MRDGSSSKVKEVTKIGPLSLDLVVACKIYEHQTTEGAGVEFMKLVRSLDGIVSKSSILNAVNTLSDWGIVKTEFGETEAGRAGRLYYVSGEAESMIRATYEQFWDKVLEAIRS